MAKINKYGNFTTHPDLSSSVELKTYWHDMLHHNANFFPISLFKADILENVKYVKNTTEILNAKWASYLSIFETLSNLNEKW